MSPQAVIDILQAAFLVGLKLALPMMLATLIVGVTVSVFQSVTSIQEQTLSFVPKIVAVFVTAVVCFSWMVSTLMTFTINLIDSIPGLLK
jgi:flagellar biosynthetic protein FliQ